VCDARGVSEVPDAGDDADGARCGLAAGGGSLTMAMRNPPKRRVLIVRVRYVAG